MSLTDSRVYQGTLTTHVPRRQEARASPGKATAQFRGGAIAGLQSTYSRTAVHLRPQLYQLRFISEVRLPSLARSSPVKQMDIEALPRRCRPFSRTESGPLKSQEQYKTQRRSASALFPIAHEKPFFVVGSWSLGPRHVLEINERNCGSENKKDLGEDTSRGEITKGGRSGGIVVGG